MRRSLCRFCKAPLTSVFADLGASPVANAYLRPDELGQMEPFYPLRAFVCEDCFLVQLEDYESPDSLFKEYAYFSSYSTTWLEHSRRYVDMAVERFGLGPESQVVEVASNDGYLLQYFVERDVPALGIEPAANVAEVARARGVRTLVKFFGRATAREVGAMVHADLLVANNVLAHVPDLNDFVAGLKLVLAPDGVLTLEFPQLAAMIADNEFDTIYHEHFSYFSVCTAQRVLARHGLTVFDLDVLTTHGGSVRIYARHDEDATKPVSDSVTTGIERERDAGFERLDTYRSFADGIPAAKWSLLEVLIRARRQGTQVVGYGAPAKASTLLNYCGIGPDLLDYTVDLNPEKQGRFIPGVRIPIQRPDEIERTRPGLVFILPWNLKDEIMQQLDPIREWGGRFLVCTPSLEVLP